MAQSLDADVRACRPGVRGAGRRATAGFAVGACCFAAALAAASAAHADEQSQTPAKARIEAWLEGAEEGLARAQRPHFDLRRGPLNEPHNRSTTGTSWLPSTAPSYGLLFPVRLWGMFVRGNIFAGYGWGSSPRGAQGFLAGNTLLLAALGQIGQGELTLRTVLGWEAYTLPEGLPAPLHHEARLDEDRRAPRRLFHELAAKFVWPVADRVALQLYLAPSGSPALATADPAFRPSGFFDPIVPLSVGVLESTHSVPGVATLGVFTRRFKIEGSWFRSPPLERSGHGLDFGPLDAGSVRFAMVPTPPLAVSMSYGRVREPLFAWHSDRVLASAVWSAGLADSGLNASLIAGLNRLPGGGLEPGAVLEASWTALGHHTLYGRVEGLREAGERWSNDLRAWTSTASVSAGYAYAFKPFAAIAPSLGVRGQCGVVSRTLRPLYGGSTSVVGGFTVYAQLRQASLPRPIAGPRPGAR